MTNPITPTEADREAAEAFLAAAPWEDVDAQLANAFARHAAAARLEGAKAACDRIEDAISRGYPALPDENDKCEHDKFGWEECIACYDDFLCAEIEAIRSLDPNKVLEGR